MPIISNFPSGGAVPKNIVTVHGGGNMELAESLGVGPYTIEINEDEAGGAAGKSAYDAAVEGGYTGTEEEFNQQLASGPWLPTDEAETLPYVKKTGDTMTGTLTVTSENMPEDAHISVTTDDSNIELNKYGIIKTFNDETKQAVGIGLSERGEDSLIMLNNSIIGGVKDGTESDDAATIGQLTARIAALENALKPLITQAQTDATAAKDTAANANSIANEAKEASAGGPFLPLKGGTLMGEVSLGNAIASISSLNIGFPAVKTSAGNIPTIFNVGYGFEYPKNITGNRLQGVLTPIYDNDAANKAYVDKVERVARFNADIPLGSTKTISISTTESSMQLSNGKNSYYSFLLYKDNALIGCLNISVGSRAYQTIRLPSGYESTILLSVTDNGGSLTEYNNLKYKLMSGVSFTAYVTISRCAMD